jgi:hypothetical protein
MSVNPYQSPDSPGQLPPKAAAFRFTLLHLLALIAMAGVVTALFLPAVRVAREPARQSQCANNLKQIALALHLYHEKHGVLPPACTVDGDGKPLHSWRTLILPYLEQKHVYDSIDLSKPWDDPANKAALEAVVQTYTCPSNPCPPGHTTYLGIVAPGSCLQPGQSRALDEIEGGPTLIVIEVDVAHAVHWMSPQDASEDMVLQMGGVEKLPHPGGFQAATTDGGVKLISANTKPGELRAAISVARD